MTTITTQTPGPWRKGHGSFIVSDNPAPGCQGSDDTEYYGGHLICESVSSANARLIAAAPELLAACRSLVAAMGSDLHDLRLAHLDAQAAIAAATGEDE